jgi:hypothetical protein
MNGKLDGIRDEGVKELSDNCSFYLARCPRRTPAAARMTARRALVRLAREMSYER